MFHNMRVGFAAKSALRALRRRSCHGVQQRFFTSLQASFISRIRRWTMPIPDCSRPASLK